MILSWNTTKRCNLFCQHCYRESDGQCAENELTTEEGLKLIDQIKEAGLFRILILSGGEPLLRDDLEQLAAHAKALGLIPVLGTNGTLLTKKRARSLKDAGVAAVGISIDSVHKAQHDAFRQTPGAYEQALTGIENALEAGMRVQINPTLTQDNVEELDALIQMAEKWGVHALHPFFLVEAGRGKCISENALSNAAYFEALKKVVQKQPHVNIELKPTCAPQFMTLAKNMGIPMRFTRGCLAGIGYCCILPDGEVHVCPYLPIKAGNVREMPFNEIWETSPVFKALRSSENYEGHCGSCQNHSICGGCRARAYYQNGHYLKEDPMSTYCYQPKGGNR